MTDSPDISVLVKEGAEIKAKIKALQEELKTVEAKIIAAGAGKRTHGSSSCVVIQPKPKFDPSQEAIAQARELIGFRKLFNRNVTYSAVEGVRNVATALLTPGKVKKFLELCEKEVKAFLKW